MTQIDGDRLLPVTITSMTKLASVDIYTMGKRSASVMVDCLYVALLIAGATQFLLQLLPHIHPFIVHTFIKPPGCRPGYGTASSVEQSGETVTLQVSLPGIEPATTWLADCC